MQRDNYFDLNMRDLAAIRDHARAATEQHDAAGVGACMVDGTACGTSAPRCTNFDLNYLDSNYTQTTVVFRALAGQAVTTVTVNPLDSFFCPVAIAGVGFDAVDGTTARPFWIIQASIRGCLQYEWQNPTDTVAGAVGFVHSDEIDPKFRSACACPVNYGCFTNTAMSSYQLQLVIGNPAAPGITTTGKVTLWGIPYTCCPAWTNMQNMSKPRDITPTAPPAPAGRAAAFGGARA